MSAGLGYQSHRPLWIGRASIPERKLPAVLCAHMHDDWKEKPFHEYFNIEMKTKDFWRHFTNEKAKYFRKRQLSYWRWNFFFFTPWETRRGRKKNGSSPCQKMGKQRKRLCGRIAACRDDGERCKARDLILNRVGATFGFVNVTCGTRGWGSFLLRKLFPSSSSPNSSNRIKGKHPFLKKKLNENQIT